MSEITFPVRCLLCNARDGIVSAGFHQVYPQKNSSPVFLDWWECRTCKGWFVHPAPTPEVIEEHWETIAYNDPKLEIKIAEAKEAVQGRILAGLSRWAKPGPMLDFGCNFGHFLVMAREAGWSPVGFDPYETGAKIARSKGFDVRCGWSLDEAGFANKHFAAITANDVFCVVWDPIATIGTFHRLLKPGGTLAMRLTNKRFILGLARALSLEGAARDARISRILIAQFHTISLASLSRILRSVGFDRIR
ncbi:MAG: class I SAM-dependent methyltransferase, partial [Candidatus Binatia bacterium]